MELGNGSLLDLDATATLALAEREVALRRRRGVQPLDHIRESMLAAARGDVDATYLRRSLLGYFEQHGPVLRSAAVTVGEEVRRQPLEQLYGWRDQLDDQLGSHRRPPPETSPG